MHSRSEAQSATVAKPGGVENDDNNLKRQRKNVLQTKLDIKSEKRDQAHKTNPFGRYALVCPREAEGRDRSEKSSVRKKKKGGAKFLTGVDIRTS